MVETSGDVTTIPDVTVAPVAAHSDASNRAGGVRMTDGTVRPSDTSAFSDLELAVGLDPAHHDPSSVRDALGHRDPHAP
jgi:hypothetical protein